LKSFTPEYQNFNSKLYEVLVVNNNSTDDTQKVLEKYVEKHDNYKCVIEKNQGLSFARNRAYKEANGEWIAYIDDDAYGKKDYMTVFVILPKINTQ
jgi:glucosyl-dolichyl phosphate glucuronosyltransferase